MTNRRLGSPLPRAGSAKTLLGLLLIGVTACGADRPAPASNAPAFVVEHVGVIPMDRPGVLQDQTIVIRGGRIETMGPAARATAPSGATRIDGRGKYLMPGLCDMHIHLAPGEGAPANDPAGRQLRLLLANGITTARVLIPSDQALHVRDRIERGEQIGPRLVVYSPSLNGQSVTSAEQGARLVDDYADKGYQGLKTHGGIPREAYDAIVAAAHRRRLPLAGHVTPEVGLKRALEAKQQIEHLDGYLAALVRDGSTAPPPDGQFVLEEAELQAIDEGKIAGVVAATRQAGVANGPTLELFSMLVGDETPEQIVAARPELRYVPDPAVRTWILQFSRFPGQQAPAVGRRRFVDLRKRLVRELHAAGCPLLAGSDSPQIFMVPGFALHRELAAMVDAGLTPQAALETATRNARRYLGDADAGTVAPGQRADLVLLEANPLDDIRNLGRVHGVLAAARWYPREALDRMLAEVEASARAAVPAPAN